MKEIKKALYSVVVLEENEWVSEEPQKTDCHPHCGALKYVVGLFLLHLLFLVINAHSSLWASASTGGKQIVQYEI